ncbi:hypothetical protein E1B28_006966 [Marasmius oreades]|uniref:Uncharacterized protein n=1 Tax=Marasmius oreades TaxID=181124 RepID=A0A9P7S0S4_9AGAR|nr:uncharacterized protein E1B28_006966 [Marasmius oreades]KAG7093284.1 hypothetical protein E1B28_006966 [Marasmius oreades]
MLDGRMLSGTAGFILYKLDSTWHYNPPIIGSDNFVGIDGMRAHRAGRSQLRLGFFHKSIPSFASAILTVLIRLSYLWRIGRTAHPSGPYIFTIVKTYVLSSLGPRVTLYPSFFEETSIFKTSDYSAHEC